MRITGGSLKNQPLKAPKGSKTRPTSEKLRETVFNIAQNHVEGATFLDLFAGSGAMGIEALSRGAKKASFIEKERSAAQALKSNLEQLHLSQQATVIIGDVLSALKRGKKGSYDLIYIDPPYSKGLQEKTLLLIDQLGLLQPGGLLFVEESSQKTWEIPPLQTLMLARKRKVGSTFLYEFK